MYICSLNRFIPAELFGMFQIKVLTIPFQILWFERVRDMSQFEKSTLQGVGRLTVDISYSILCSMYGNWVFTS